MPVPIVPCHKRLVKVESSTRGGRFITTQLVPIYLDTRAGKTIYNVMDSKM